MRTISIALCITAILLLARPAYADGTVYLLGGGDPDWLHFRKNQKITVVPFDSIKDGCWTNVDQTINAVAVELQRSGFNVATAQNIKEAAGNRLVVHGLGYAVGHDNSLCIATLELIYLPIRVDRVTFSSSKKEISSSKQEVIAIGRRQMWSSLVLISGGKGDFNRQVKDEFISLAQSFLLDVPKRQNVALKSIRDSATNNREKDPDAHTFWSNYKLE